MTLVHPIRRARPGDVVAIERLMAPEVARGTVLPRAVDPRDFLVGEQVCAALTPWSSTVVELGSVVSARPGMGALVVEAALAEAAARGFAQVVVLTALTEWFARRGFTTVKAPLDLKEQHCMGCPLRAGCRQVLMVRDVV
jgi:N-acetylglutamate synthase-like GNAT family acetyltransferase